VTSILVDILYEIATYVRSVWIAISSATAQQPLMEHLRRNDNAVGVSRLLNKGMNPNISDILQMTPLMLAAGNGNANNLDLLLTHGANVSPRDFAGHTALMYASTAFNSHFPSFRFARLTREEGIPFKRVPYFADYPACISRLCDAGSDINAQDGYGATPLLLAVECGLVDNVKALLKWNPDLHRADKSDRTPLSRAMESPTINAC
jgi:uncharacterized protein